jgi:hypothetical protein
VGQSVAQGYYSLLRWRPDATRDEARNIAVLLVDEVHDFASLEHAPLSSISQRLREQGILDDVLVGLKERLASIAEMGSDELRALSRDFQRSLVVTAPKRVAVDDPAATLHALYGAFVAPRRGGGSRAPTKGVILDRVVQALRAQGARARRGAYIDDFIFDVVVEGERDRAVFEVLSFAVERKDWTPVERDAGHFLYAVQRLEVHGRAVVQPPLNGHSAAESYKRVRRWLDTEKVPIVAPEDLKDQQLALDVIPA